MRHNETRDKLFKWAQRARLNPVLEKAGILNENDVICMRRPADVLVDDPGTRIDKVALDIKVINALGPGHIEATMHSSSAAADAYRLQALEHQDTARQCLERGIRYEPLVFTAQGGMQLIESGFDIFPIISGLSFASGITILFFFGAFGPIFKCVSMCVDDCRINPVKKTCLQYF